MISPIYACLLLVLANHLCCTHTLQTYISLQTLENRNYSWHANWS
jgi:hypothetical protein